MSDRDALDAAINAYDKARDYLRGLDPCGLQGHLRWAERQVEEARAAVRKAAEEMGETKEAGVMYATVGIVNPCPTSRTECTIGVLLPWLQSGDRVTVRRCGEGE